MSAALLALLVTFTPCATEDSPGPCYWDASAQGNGVGHSFYVDAQNNVLYGKDEYKL